MKKFLHRIVRRIILWANTPTAEEIAAANEARAVELRECRLRRVEAVLMRDPKPFQYVGLSREDVETLEQDFQVLASRGHIPEGRVAAHIAELRKQSGRYPRAA